MIRAVSTRLAKTVKGPSRDPRARICVPGTRGLCMIQQPARVWDDRQELNFDVSNLSRVDGRMRGEELKVPQSAFFTPRFIVNIPIPFQSAKRGKEHDGTRVNPMSRVTCQAG